MSYKDVLATQEGSGLWSPKVLEFTTTKTITQLIYSVKVTELMKAKFGLSREIKPFEWYTLVGLKLLEDNFKDDEPSWWQAVS